MNQEQLSLETCQEIGHLFPESEKVWQTILDGCYAGSKSCFERNLIEDWQLELPQSFEYVNHPSITDMIRWLWEIEAHGLDLTNVYDSYHGRTTNWNLTDCKDGGYYGSVKADSPIEAYAEAVKLVMEKEDGRES